jgi:hypothetical protein
LFRISEGEGVENLNVVLIITPWVFLGLLGGSTYYCKKACKNCANHDDHERLWH